MGRRTFLMHFVPFPGASPFLTATVLRPPSGQLPPPNTFIRLRMAVPSSGSGAVVVRCRDRAGSRESMVAGACGGCNGCGRMGRRKAAAPCTQSVPQGTTACRIGTGPQRTGSLRSLLCARMAAAKKACAPFGDTGRKSRLVKGEFLGEALSYRQQRCDRMAAAGRARCDAGSYGHRQQRCDRMAAAGRARCDAGSYGHRQQRCDRMAAAGRAR